MNFWEKLVIGLLAIGESQAPLFIHSAKGTVILNAEEPLVNALIGQLAAGATNTQKAAQGGATSSGSTFIAGAQGQQTN